MYHSFNECRPENWAVDNLSLYPDDLHAKVRSSGPRTIVTPQIQGRISLSNGGQISRSACLISFWR